MEENVNAIENYDGQIVDEFMEEEKKNEQKLYIKIQFVDNEYLYFNQENHSLNFEGTIVNIFNNVNPDQPQVVATINVASIKYIRYNFEDRRNKNREQRNSYQPYRSNNNRNSNRHSGRYPWPR